MQKVPPGLIGIAVLALVLLAWIGGEVHYRNCLTEAELRNPVAARWKPGHRETTIGGVPLGQPQESGPAEPGHFVFNRQQDRDTALGQCSRWPF